MVTKWEGLLFINGARTVSKNMVKMTRLENLMNLENKVFNNMWCYFENF